MQNGQTTIKQKEISKYGGNKAGSEKSSRRINSKLVIDLQEQNAVKYRHTNARIFGSAFVGHFKKRVQEKNPFVTVMRMGNILKENVFEKWFEILPTTRCSRKPFLGVQ